MKALVKSYNIQLVDINSLIFFIRIKYLHDYLCFKWIQSVFDIKHFLKCFLAWADLEVNMEDRVEVFRGETAQITCMFVSTEGIGGTIIQWFYVS